MAGKCIFCGYSGSQEAMESHAGDCPILDENFQTMSVAPGSENICQGFKQCNISKFDKNGGHCQECFDDAQQAIEQSMKDIEKRRIL